MTKMYYDDYSNGCVIVPKPIKQKDDYCEEIKEDNCKKEDVCEKENRCENDCNDLCCKKTNQLTFFESFLPNFKIDDIILIAIILMFLNDGCEDKTLLIIVGVIFLLGFNEKC